MRKIDTPWARIIVALGLIVAFYVIVSFFAPSTEIIEQAVQSAGYSDVTVTEPNVLLARFYCARSDYFYYKVPSAINAKGDTVKNMYVCAGLFKGQTIRYK